MKRYGLIATFVYLSLIVLWIYLDWQRFCMLAPNEWGDFLAGTIGPLALLWVVLSFWLQSNELQNSVNALQLQAEELRNSVEQQQEMVRVTRESLTHEQNKLEKAGKDKKRAMQPHFNVKFGSSVGRGDMHGKFSFSVLVSKNQPLNLNIFSADKSLRVARRTVPFAEIGKTIDLPAYSGNLVERPEGPLHLTISYTDDDGDTQEITYMFHTSPGQKVFAPYETKVLHSTLTEA